MERSGPRPALRERQALNPCLALNFCHMRQFFGLHGAIYGTGPRLSSLYEVKLGLRANSGANTPRLFCRLRPMNEIAEFWTNSGQDHLQPHRQLDRFDGASAQAITRAAVKSPVVFDIRVSICRIPPAPFSRLGDMNPAPDRRCIRAAYGLMFTTICEQ